MKVFITRNIKRTDFFKTELEKVGFSVFGQSLIVFSAVDFGRIPDCEWLFFYSKNGVKFFFDNLNQVDLNQIINKKIATIGEGTARFLIQKYQRKPDFVGTGEPLQTARAFAQIAAKKRVLFPRAKQSKQSIQKQLGNTIIQQDLVVYANQPIDFFESKNANILVFTSPMNVNAYFHFVDYKPGQKVVAIGNTTATALQNMGIEKIIIAKNPNEIGLVKAVLE